MGTGCTYFDAGGCRSCGLLGLPYAAQLQRKLELLQSVLQTSPALPAPQPVIPADSLFSSRNKAKMAVARAGEEIVLGYTTSQGESVEIGGCPLHIPPIPAVIESARRAVRDAGLEPYDVSARSGELKYLIVRASESTGEVMLRLVLRSREQLGVARMVLAEIASKEPRTVVQSINFQSVHQAIVEGPEELLVSEREYLHDRLGSFTLAVAPQSFSQVTSSVAVKLYSYVASKVAAARPRRLLDLFCGNGAFSIFCADSVVEGVGVEISEAAVRSAQKTFELNAKTNFSFQAADAGCYIQKSSGFDAVIVNPPRRGIGEQTAAALIQQRPPLLIYSSCHPRSFVTDLSVLAAAYEVVDVQPFDMFPGTEHVEVVAELRLR